MVDVELRGTAFGQGEMSMGYLLASATYHKLTPPPGEITGISCNFYRSPQFGSQCEEHSRLRRQSLVAGWLGSLGFLCFKPSSGKSGSVSAQTRSIFIETRSHGTGGSD